MTERSAVRIEPWGADDLSLLVQLNDPAMTVHVGGPETPEKVAERQARYAEAGSRQYRIVVESGEAVGWVGYWELFWQDESIWEIGWSVIPGFQGRGIASSATAQLLEEARDERLHPSVHAFPKVENVPSNAICRTLGFTFLGEVDFEGRAGIIRCNDWRFDLFPALHDRGYFEGVSARIR